MDDFTAPESSPIPPPNGLKKPFTRQARSWTEIEGPSGPPHGQGPASTDEVNEKLRPATSGGSGRDDDSKSGGNSISRLMRRRKKKKQSSQEEADLDSDHSRRQRGGSNDDVSLSVSNSQSTLDVNDNPSPLLTDYDSDPDSTPAPATTNAGLGYFTSSPLITTTAVDGSEAVHADTESMKSAPSAASASTSDLRSQTNGQDGLVPARNGRSDSSASKSSISRTTKERSPSRSRNNSPDRESAKSSSSKKSRNIFGKENRRPSFGFKRAAKTAEDVPPLPTPIRTDILEKTASTPALPLLDTAPPRTPPRNQITAPVTTVTPPTPTEPRVRSDSNPPPAQILPTSSPSNELSRLPPNVVVSPSGNMISHRRVRSASSAHQPSKLSNSIAAPLTPTIEESQSAASSRTPSSNPPGGFFSSMFSAAQNAASTFSNTLNGPARNRSATVPPEAESSPTIEKAFELPQKLVEYESDQKKASAVDTLGSGDLDFSQLGLDPPQGSTVTTKDGVVFTKTDSDPTKGKAAQRDELAARLEDLRAARAVSMAYDRNPQEVPASTPLAEDITDTRSRPASVGLGLGGESTPPGGSVIDGEGEGLKRSGSVRSRLANRRQRGSSGATGTTVGAIGAAMAMGLPGANVSVPRLTGFAVASKKRNREFHQLFRSVPEDDFLIEDYSCALQREIILAGRIYISEGHICFSSNILGWVTTLVISFDEIVAIEKENTAMVFPNAIAIQTLHARHTFRSLLSRESTYDLMVNIWKINHPALKSSVNGTRVEQGTGDKTEKADDEDDAASDRLSDEDEVYDEDEDGDGTGSFIEANGSVISDKADSIKHVNGRTATMPLNGPGTPAMPMPAIPADSKGGEKAGISGGEASADFPGPATHAPTEFTDPSGRYDRVVKDEIVPAPLGKVYSMVFGPASGVFMSKFLSEDQKCLELQFEDDKKGLTNENKKRFYTYIKPLNGPIGPKQTRCNTTEQLDVLDFDKAVLVTITTQTPDVPNGNVFSVKTKYLFTWAPGNATRFFMSCTVEWTGKSWIKGPIEKGANDGQLAYGTDIIKALKAGVTRTRGANGAGKGAGKSGKGKRRKDSAMEQVESAVAAKAALEASKREAENWGILEPLRPLLGPVVGLFRPLFSSNVVLGVVVLLLFAIWYRSPTSQRRTPALGDPLSLSLPDRIIAYEELWRREESELWNWLEERVGMEGFAFPVADGSWITEPRRREHRNRILRKGFEERLDDEHMTDREMNDAIRVTQQRLDVLRDVMEKKKRLKTPAVDTETA